MVTYFSIFLNGTRVGKLKKSLSFFKIFQFLVTFLVISILNVQLSVTTNYQERNLFTVKILLIMNFLIQSLAFALLKLESAVTNQS